MSNLDTYPLITVKRLGESRDFFVKYFGMRQRRFMVQDPSGILVDVVEQSSRLRGSGTSTWADAEAPAQN